MPQMRDDGSDTGGGVNAPAADAAMTVFGTGNPERDLSAIVLVFLAEINTLRTHAAIGLPALTVANIETAFNAKKV